MLALGSGFAHAVCTERELSRQLDILLPLLNRMSEKSPEYIRIMAAIDQLDAERPITESTCTRLTALVAQAQR